MSIACLRCGHPLEQDFGLIACLNCGAILSIDFDGQVQMVDGSQNQEARSVESGPLDLTSGLPNQIEDEVQPMDSMDSMDSLEVVEGPEKSNFDYSQTVGDQPNPLQNDEPDSLAFNPLARDDEEKISMVLSSAQETEPIETLSGEVRIDESQSLNPVREPASLNEGFAEVVEFANSEGVSALSYDLSLDGLEDLEVREKVISVLTETRLQMDRQKVEKSIEDGKLKLKKLSASQVSFILHHILDLPVVPSWTQHLFNR